jgi:hypothetical protein
LKIRLSPEDLSRVRFAFSPLQEVVMSLGALSARPSPLRAARATSPTS